MGPGSTLLKKSMCNHYVGDKSQEDVRNTYDMVIALVEQLLLNQALW